jgi:hypothetical protein
MSLKKYGETGLPLINIASDYLTECWTDPGYQAAAEKLLDDLGLPYTLNEDTRHQIVEYVNKEMKDNNDDYRITSDGTINTLTGAAEKQLLVENLNKIYEKKGCYKSILRNIRQLFVENKDLVNMPLSSSRDDDGVTLFIRSPIFWITDKFDETYILPFLNLLKEFTVNPLIRDSNGNTILMQAIKEGDLPLLENLFLVFGFNEICINPNEENGVDPKLAMFYLAVEMNDNNTSGQTSKILNEMFTYLLNAIFTDTSNDNYKLLPAPASLNHIDINAMIQLYDTKTREIVAQATPLDFAYEGYFPDDTGNIITNDDKIVEYLVKNGADVTDPRIVHAFVKTRIPFIYDPPSSPNISESFLGGQGVKPSPSILKILLVAGAPVDLNIIIFLKKVLEIPQNEPYVRELKEMLNLLKEASAIHFILMTPITTTFDMDDIEMARSIFIEDNPDSFDTHTNPYDDKLQPLKINPSQTGFDVLTGEINISVFLEEDTENHIVLRNYDDDKVTFLVNLKDVRNAIEVHETPEGNLEGGRAIYFPCIGNINGRWNITTRDVNNTRPYFNMTNVMGAGGGFIPLLEVYSKILNIKPSERGQYFSFKMTGDIVGPLADVNIINYNNSGENIYGHNINVVSAWHCQDGTTGSVVRIVAAEPLTVRVTNLGGSIHSSKSKRRYKYKYKHTRNLKSIKKHKKTRNRVNKHKKHKKHKITRKLRK